MIPGPQTELGHVQIAGGAPDNDVFSALIAAQLTGVEYQIALTVIRKTWGFKKKEDWISLTQFQKITGASRSHVCRSILTLVSQRILVARKGLGKTFYSMNKRFNEWVVSPMALVPQKGLELVPLAHAASPVDKTQLVPPTGHTKEIPTKETITKERAALKTDGVRTDTPTEWTDADVLKLERQFMERVEALNAADRGAAMKTWEQSKNLRQANRLNFYRKVTLFVTWSRARTEKGQNKARVLYNEIAGFVNDRGAMEQVLDGKDIAKRQQFAREEYGKGYVESEL